MNKTLLSMIESNNDCINACNQELLSITNSKRDTFMLSAEQEERLKQLESTKQSFIKSNKLIRKIIKLEAKDAL